MYIPKHFELKDMDTIYDFIEKNSFAALYTLHNGQPYATHLPLALNKEECALYGHFARANKQWKDAENQQTLVVFQGPHCYISPSWYETADAVPTWNYIAIHLYGEMEILTDDKIIWNSLIDLVDQYERPDSSYKLDDADPGFIEGMSKGIVAFKIHIAKMEAKAKLSQNHPAERQKLIIGHLEKSSNEDDRQIAALMKMNLT